MKEISRRQKQILDFIARCVREKGYPPSVREIGEAVGLASSSTVHGHLGKLEDKGYIKRDPTKPRAIEVVGLTGTTAPNLVNVPVVGRVTAGQPILAVENLEGHFPIASEMMPDENVFMLKIQGNSMIDAGILDGDFVFVHQQSHATNGEIVVALVEDEATVKRFFREKDHIRLQPENPTMDPIIVPDASVLGKVVGVFRRVQ